MLKTIILSLTLFLYALEGFSIEMQNTSANKKVDNGSPRDHQHHKNEVNIGIIAGVGYNVLSHVDGTLSVIPSKMDPTPYPGAPVYATPMSITAEFPGFSVEYWANSKWSIENELTYTFVVAGASHPVSDFAYMFQYLKSVEGFRYYFAKHDLGYLFVGSGMSVYIPVAHPKIGFIKAASMEKTTFGPYAEVGVNHPFSDTMSLGLSARFTFNVLPMSEKTDPAMLAQVITSPVELLFNMSYRM